MREYDVLVKHVLIEDVLMEDVLGEGVSEQRTPSSFPICSISYIRTLGFWRIVRCISPD